MFSKTSYLKHRLLLFLILLSFNSPNLLAQYGRISGKVVDYETGEALIGCNVLLEGTSIGAAVDIDGDYTKLLSEMQLLKVVLER